MATRKKTKKKGTAERKRAGGGQTDSAVGDLMAAIARFWLYGVEHGLLPEPTDADKLTASAILRPTANRTKG